MQKRQHHALLVVLSLILITGVAMAITRQNSPDRGPTGPYAGSPSTLPDGLSVSARLVQDKVLLGSKGMVTMALTLQTPPAPTSDRQPQKAVDLVVVLDRSGSMNGRKISDARRAVQRLIGHLSPQDRLALVAYDNGAEPLSGLLPMTAANQHELSTLIGKVHPGGGTNLGGGLQAGLEILSATASDSAHRKLVLISDGLANQGVTDPHALAQMAAGGLAHDWVVSTVGVGHDFNEHLMTTLADHGAGHYYYLENPAAFAAVFEREYRQAVTTAASAIAIRMPRHAGINLVDAGGYPIQAADGNITIHPGNMRYGQTRTLYLTFQITTDTPRKVTIQGLQVHFTDRGGQLKTSSLANAFTIACVDNADEVVASIRKEAWAQKVLQEDFGRLKEAVADAIRSGDKEQAMAQIQLYRQEKAELNRVVASPQVSENLEKEVHALGAYVEDTFAGKPAAVRAKQKKNAKTLQYEGYQKRRDIN